MVLREPQVLMHGDSDMQDQHGTIDSWVGIKGTFLCIHEEPSGCILIWSGLNSEFIKQERFDYLGEFRGEKFGLLEI